MQLRFVIFLFLVFVLSACASVSNENIPIIDNPVSAIDPLTQNSYEHLRSLASVNGIGIRESGSENERKAAQYILSAFESFGYEVTLQSFDYVNRDTGEAQLSQNVIAEKTGSSNKQMIIGAHYDSKGAELGSLGASDNAASIATMLSIAEIASTLTTLETGLRFVAFGAEEVGLEGAKHYVAKMTATQKQNALGMINLDGIVGGDILYIHSAHSEPYTCDEGQSEYAHSPWLRDQLISIAAQVTPEGTFVRHPGFEGYPSGETGGWSDHKPFACAGIPIGNFEATNFSINGESGRDGYSQSVHPNLWTCFDPIEVGPCDRDTEQKWGKIWHTENDTIEILESIHPGRIRQQLSDNLKVLRAFVEDLDNNITSSTGNPET